MTRARPRPIILVEDDPDDVSLMERAVAKAKLEIPLQIAPDVDEAVNYLLGHGVYADRNRYPLPELVLLSLDLAGRSGLDVLACIREELALKRLLVVVLTSSQEPADVNTAYDLGANSYLVKPIRFAALLKLVKAVALYWLTLNEQPQVG